MTRKLRLLSTVAFCAIAITAQAPAAVKQTTPQANAADQAAKNTPDTNGFICQFAGCVYNAEEQLIGSAAGQGLLERRMAGTSWYIGWTVEGGFDTGYRLYFTVANCAQGAQPYLTLTGWTDASLKFFQQPPHTAIYYNGHIWGPAGAPETITVKSYRKVDTNECVNENPYSEYGVSKMYYLDTVDGAAPFSLQH